MNKLRTIEARALTPKCRGRCRTALLALWGDTVGMKGFAPVLRLGQGSLGGWHWFPRLVGQIYFTPAQASFRSCLHIRGPIGAASIALGRVGWSFHSAFVFKDERGCEIKQVETSLAMMSCLLQRALQRRWEQMLRTKVCGNTSSGW